MKRIVLGLALLSFASAAFAEQGYVVIAKYRGGKLVQISTELPTEQACMEHIGSMNLAARRDFRLIELPVTCEKADAQMIEHVFADGKNTVQPFGGHTTAALCEQWQSTPRGPGEPTYTCEAVAP